MGIKKGDIMLNSKGTNDLWLVVEKDNVLFYELINDGERIPVDEPIGFIKIGELSRSLKLKQKP